MNNNKIKKKSKRLQKSIGGGDEEKISYMFRTQLESIGGVVVQMNKHKE